LSVRFTLLPRKLETRVQERYGERDVELGHYKHRKKIADPRD